MIKDKPKFKSKGNPNYNRDPKTGKLLPSTGKTSPQESQAVTAICASVPANGFKSLPDLLKFLQNLDYLAMTALVKGLKSPRLKEKMDAFKEWRFLRFELPLKLQFQQSLGDTLTRLSVMELEKIAHVRTMEEKRELLADYEVLE